MKPKAMFAPPREQKNCREGTRRKGRERVGEGKGKGIIIIIIALTISNAP